VPAQKQLIKFVKKKPFFSSLPLLSDIFVGGFVFAEKKNDVFIAMKRKGHVSIESPVEARK
jgi:hypothetical protein